MKSWLGHPACSGKDTLCKVGQVSRVLRCLAKSMRFLAQQYLSTWPLRQVLYFSINLATMARIEVQLLRRSCLDGTHMESQLRSSLFVVLVGVVFSLPSSSAI